MKILRRYLSIDASLGVWTLPVENRKKTISRLEVRPRRCFILSPQCESLILIVSYLVLHTR